MKKLGGIVAGIGMVMAILIVSTNDYYTMELRIDHPTDVKGIVISMILMGIGLLIWWISDNFYFDIDIRRKGRKR